MNMIKELMERIKINEVSDLAAVLAYYFLLSLFPLLIFMVAILPYFSLDATEITDIIKQYAPGETGDMLTSHIGELLNNPHGGLLSFGILATLWSASNGANALIRSLNKAFLVEETRPFWKVRLHALIMTIGLVLTFVITLALPIFGSVIIDFVSSYLPSVADNQIVLNVSRFIFSFLTMCAVLTVLYMLAPNEKVTFKEAYLGAIIGTVLWQIISLAFSFYVSQFGNFNATYGSLGAVIVLLTWLYLSGFAILIGGEINAIRQCRVSGKKCINRSNAGLGNQQPSERVSS